MNDAKLLPILAHKNYAASSVFTPENLLREARRPAALYAFAKARGRNVLCFAHVTNQMGRVEGDFEKGAADGAKESLHVVSLAAERWRAAETPIGTGI